jgi:hypothetical protein
VKNHFVTVLGLCAVLIGCAGEEPTPPTPPPQDGPAGPVTYRLELRLVPIGGPNQTVALPVRLGETLRIPDRAGPEVITNLYTRVGCWPAEENLNQGLANAGIPAGDAARIETLSIEIDASDLVAPHPVCYGYRTRGGSWHWKLEPVAPQPENGGGAPSLRAQFSVGASDVDALAILPGDAWLRALSYVARREPPR